MNSELEYTGDLLRNIATKCCIGKASLMPYIETTSSCVLKMVYNLHTQKAIYINDTINQWYIWWAWSNFQSSLVKCGVRKQLTLLCLRNSKKASLYLEIKKYIENIYDCKDY